MAVQVGYSLNDIAQLRIISELRKFFTVPAVAPYNTKLPTGTFIPTDLIYTESVPGKPTGKLNIVDEENFDDRKLPAIILTGMSGPMKPMGLGQRGLKQNETNDPIPTLVTPVKVATVLPKTFTADFENGKFIDSVLLLTGDRILIKDQMDATQNGVYIVQALGAPVRSTDFDQAVEFVQYTVIDVLDGLLNIGKQFMQTTAQPIVLGTTQINYTEPEFEEYVEMSEPTITFGIRTLTTSQRARLVDLLMFAISNKQLVRGELEKQEIYFQPTGPGFIRNNGFSEEGMYNGTAYQQIYKAELSSTLFLQWNYRVLREQYNAESIKPIRQFS